MTQLSDAARQYLLAPSQSFWNWADRGTVVAWKDGGTIAFIDELKHVLGHLAPRGLPPLGGVLLLLAATRQDWNLEEQLPASLWLCPDNELADELIARVTPGLRNIRSLKIGDRASLRAKSVLAEMVFESTARRSSPELASEVLHALHVGLDEDVFLQPSDGDPDEGRDTSDDTLIWEEGSADAASSSIWIGAQRSSSAFAPRWKVLVQELEDFAEGMERLDGERLERLRRTGMEDRLHPADANHSPSESVRAMLLRLREDQQLLGGLARLARNVMAAVTLPRPVSQENDLPLGGVSDISNRGPLDRLLLSELAHDDLTLTTRLAVNEALYLRREAPPKVPARERIVVVETGIRCWGVPRVFATAVALALVATSTKETRVEVLRASDGTLARVDLTTRDGLLAHLERLDTDPHPGAALRELASRLSDRGEACEVVLVTTEQSAADPQFRGLLRSQRIPGLQLATIAGDGRLRLRRVSQHGEAMIREVKMSLDELFNEGRRPDVKLLDRDWARDLPAILLVHPFPLLLPFHATPYRVWRVGPAGGLVLTSDRRLMWWQGIHRGGQQVADDLPRGKVLWSGEPDAGGRLAAIVGRRAGPPPSLLQIDLHRWKCRHSPLVCRSHGQRGQGRRGVCVRDGTIFLIYPESVEALDLESGRHLATLRIPKELRWVRDRFFRDLRDDSWHGLTYDAGPRFFPLLPPSDDSRPPLVSLVESPGIEGREGLVGITSDGGLHYFASRDTIVPEHGLRPPVQLLAVSHDATHIVIGSARGRDTITDMAIVEVSTARIAKVTKPVELMVNEGLSPWALRPLMSKMPLHREFRCVAIARGRIQLFSRGGEVHDIGFASATRHIMMMPWPRHFGSFGSHGKQFERLSVPRVGYTLSVARWEDGSCIYLDSRGLLHLKSANRGVPELSIVLTTGRLAGWCADGRCWGPSYFIRERESADEAAIYSSAITAFIGSLP